MVFAVPVSSEGFGLRFGFWLKTDNFEIHLADTKPQGITYCSGAYLFKENSNLKLSSPS